MYLDRTLPVTHPSVKLRLHIHGPSSMPAVSLISSFRLNSEGKHIYHRQKHILGELTAFELCDNLSSTARALSSSCKAALTPAEIALG